MEISSANKTAIIFGASGLVGGHLLSYLLAHPNYSKVKSFGRKKLNIESNKLEQIICDTESLDTVSEQIQGNDLYITLGTTIAEAGSKEAFFAIDCTYVIDIATKAQTNGVNQCLVISGMGADTSSLFYYNRVKGTMENKLKQLEFWAIHIMRPSLLTGDRVDNRVGEKIGEVIGNGIKALTGSLFSKWTPIAAKVVAKSMVQVAQGIDSGTYLHLSDEIKEIGKIDNQLTRRK